MVGCSRSGAAAVSSWRPPTGLLSSVDGAVALVPEVCAPPELRTITPDSSVVTVCDGEADAPDLVKRPPDSSSVECSEEVVDVGLVDDECDADG